MSTYIKNALTSATGSALFPEDLSPALVEYLQKASPLFAMLPRRGVTSTPHQYVVRTALPNAWVEAEGTDPQFSNSSYQRKSVDIKVLRSWGSVTGFTQRFTEQFIDALAAEIDGSMASLTDVFENQILWGDTADALQMKGLEQFMREDSTALANNIFAPAAALTLSDLDNALDTVEVYRGVMRDPKAFVMSPQMISRVTSLLTRIQRTVSEVEIEGGFRVATYRGVPLLPSGFVRPANTTTSPAVTATAAAGGTVPDGTYYYAISSVTMYGEQTVGAEANVTLGTGNNTTNLTWTADPNAVLYKVWRGTVSGNLELLDVIPAKTYTNGAPTGNVTSYSDDGTKTPVAQIKPLQVVSGVVDETVYLVNLSRDRGLYLAGGVSPLGEQTEEFVTLTPLATRKSSFDFMIESFTALVVQQPVVNVIIRNVRAG